MSKYFIFVGQWVQVAKELFSEFTGWKVVDTGKPPKKIKNREEFKKQFKILKEN